MKSENDYKNQVRVRFRGHFGAMVKVKVRVIVRVSHIECSFKSALELGSRSG